MRPPWWRGVECVYYYFYLVVEVEAREGLREADEGLELAHCDAVAASVAAERVLLPQLPVAVDELAGAIGLDLRVEGSRVPET
jgi:hypothetical protein